MFKADDTEYGGTLYRSKLEALRAQRAEKNVLTLVSAGVNEMLRFERQFSRALEFER